MILTNIQNKYQNKNKIKINFNLSLFNKFLSILAVGVLISLVICVNDLSIQSFILKNLKNKSLQLKEENSKLELLATNLKSFENIDKKAQEMKMVKVDKINYITLTDGAVAKK